MPNPGDLNPEERVRDKNKKKIEKINISSIVLARKGHRKGANNHLGCQKNVF